MTGRAEDYTTGPFRTALIWWRRLGRDIVTMIAVGLAAWSVWLIRSESEQRRDQLCTVFEQKEHRDVDQLTQTYAYLAGQPRSELGSPLNRAILANLGTVEREARAPDAPVYCNDSGVGLPEPGPRIPRRPKNLPRP